MHVPIFEWCIESLVAKNGKTPKQTCVMMRLDHALKIRTNILGS